MKMQNDIQQHFSIRKLSIGAASVLIGISFLGAGAQTVHADINNDTKSQEVVETNDKTTASPVEKQAEAPAEQPAAPVEMPVAKDNADFTETKQTADDAVKKDEAKAKDTVKAETEETAADKKTESPKTDDQKDEETKETADTEKEQVLDTKGQNPVDAKTLKEQKSEEKPLWNSYDWDYSIDSNNNNLILNWYWGEDAESITVPNEADVKKAEPTRNIGHVVITKLAITSLGQHTKKLAMSGTDGKKVYAAEDMSAAFSKEYSGVWQSLDLTNLDVSNVKNMVGMISNQHELTSVGDLSGWDTRNVTSMQYMFNGDNKLESVGDLSNWDVSHVTNMSYMFGNCKALQSLTLNWGDKTKNVTNFSYMFANDPKLTSVEGIGGWNMSSATNIGHMFECVIETKYDPSNEHSFTYPDPKGSLSQLDLSKWDTRNVTNMESIFRGQKKLSSVGTFHNWKTDKVTTMAAMFDHCQNLLLGREALENMAKWNTSNVTNMKWMFENMQRQNDLSCIQNWDTKNVIDMSYMFNGDSNLENVGDLSNWDTGKVGTDQPAGENAPENQNYGMSFMFTNCGKLKKIDGIGSWNVSNVKKMRQMFAGTASLDSLDLSSWDTKNLQIASEMFAYSGVKKINLSGRDLRKLSLFSGAGMLTGNYLTIPGGQDMFAHLQNPAVIDLTGAKLPTGQNAFQLRDFQGDQPIVVFCDDPTLSDLNDQTWNNIRGRQNSDYLTVNGRKVPMDFVYKDQAALNTALAQKLAPFGNVVRTSSRVGDQAAAALQDVTGIYRTQPDEPDNPDVPDNPDKPTNPDTPDIPDTPDPGHDDHHNDNSGDDDHHQDDPEKLNIDDDKPAKPQIDDKNSQRPGRFVSHNKQAVRQMSNRRAQRAHAKLTANKLPQTGENKHAVQLGLVALGLAGVVGMLGLAVRRRRN